MEFFNHLPGDILTITQYILTIYPTLDVNWIIQKLDAIDDETADKIGEIVFKGFDDHKQMGVEARTNTYSNLLRLSIGEARDLNRHRSLGRILPFLYSNDGSPILHGYTLPLYLTDNPALQEVRDRYEADMAFYFQQIQRFNEMAMQQNWFPHFVLRQLLPLGTAVPMLMHGSIKELSYLTHLRVKPGGHINYRLLAYQMAEALSKSGKFTKTLGFGKDQKPSATSNEQFWSRK